MILLSQLYGSARINSSVTRAEALLGCPRRKPRLEQSSQSVTTSFTMQLREERKTLGCTRAAYLTCWSSCRAAFSAC